MINHIRDQVLVQMQDWILEGSLEGYRRIESRLDSGVTRKLAETMPTFERAALLRSLHAEIELFAQLRDQLSKRLDVTFNQDAQRHILDQMEKLPAARSSKPFRK